MFAQPTWLPGLGEEFAVLLEAVSIEGAQVWAERFRQDTAATAVVCGEVSISYSASMGVALLDPRLHSVEQVMLQADSALYQAKDEGATKLWAHKYFRIERSGDEGKASRPDQNISRPMGSDDVLRAL
jgi:GGDEF domain-containing protein